MDGAEPRTFSVPPSEGFVTPLFQPDEDHLVVLDTSSYLYSLLSTDENPAAIGYFSTQRILTPHEQRWSSDGRFVLLVDGEEPTGYGVYDFAAHAYVLQQPFEDNTYATIAYGEGGFVVSEDHEDHMLYRYEDGDRIQLPDGRGFYFDVLANGDLLFMQVDEPDGRAPGIYRYSPNDDAFTLRVIDSRVLAP